MRVPIRLPSRSKYSAKRTDGYASKKEAKRAAELELLAKIGWICKLEKQPSFILVPKDELGRAVYYLADFKYFDRKQQAWIVEDVKGFRTPLYRLKRRLMWSIHGIRIQEV